LRLEPPDGSSTSSGRASRWKTAISNRLTIGYAMSFLNVELFFTLADVRDKLERWRQDYNQVRPHSSLADHPPETFAARWAETAVLRPEPNPDGLRKSATGNSLEPLT
jgi:transposase InsO family protein